MGKKLIRLLICFLTIVSFVSFGSDMCKAEETVPNAIYKSFLKSNTVKIKNSEIYSAENGFVYIKYKATDDGFVKLTFKKLTSESEDFKGYIWICDRKKNALSNGEYFTSAVTSTNYTNIYYGVKKDTVYYFKVKDEKQGCKIVLTECSVKKNAGTSSEKAVAMTEKKYTVGTIPAGGNCNDYYKIVLKKDSQIDFYYLAYTNSSIYIQITRPGYYTGKFYANYPMNGVRQKSVSKKLTAGTYLVRVSGKNSACSGYYRMLWKVHSTTK